MNDVNSYVKPSSKYVFFLLLNSSGDLTQIFSTRSYFLVSNEPNKFNYPTFGLQKRLAVIYYAQAM